MENKSFWEWYNETEKEAGSLITAASAAKMLGKTRQYIEKLVNNGRLKKYYYENMPYIGMNEINKEIIKKQDKIKKINKKDNLLFLAKKEEYENRIKEARKNYNKDNSNEDWVEIKKQEEYLKNLEEIASNEEINPYSTGYKI